jgi:hypothetical protein
MRLGAVQLCRVSRDFFTRAIGGDFDATFVSVEPGPGETSDLSTRGALTRTLACIGGVMGIQTSRLLLSRACLTY